MDDVTSPSDLSFLEEGVDPENAGLLQDLFVRDLVLPPDVEESMETAPVEMVELFGVSAVDSTGVTGIEETCAHHCTVNLQLGGQHNFSLFGAAA